MGATERLLAQIAEKQAELDRLEQQRDWLANQLAIKDSNVTALEWLVSAKLAVEAQDGNRNS